MILKSMKNLICLRCGHVFHNKANLNKHYKRKTICQSKYFKHSYQYLLQNHQQLKFKRLELLNHIEQENTKTTKIKLNKEDDISEKLESLINKIKQINKGNIIPNDDIDQDILETKTTSKHNKNIYKCFCGKIYFHQSSLSRHKKSLHNKKTTLLSQLIKKKKS
jgi:hypothetical protein